MTTTSTEPPAEPVAEPPAEPAAELLTPGEAAAMLGVSTVMLRRRVQEGELDAVMTAGGHRRYHRDQIERLQQQLPPLGVRLLTAGQVARLLGVHPKTVHIWGCSGKLTRISTAGKRYRYSEDQVLRLVGPQVRGDDR